jgi:hypothetical protein
MLWERGANGRPDQARLCHRSKNFSLLHRCASPDTAEFVVRQGVSKAFPSYPAGRADPSGFGGRVANRRKEQVSIFASALRSLHPRPTIAQIQTRSETLRNGKSWRIFDHPIL